MSPDTQTLQDGFGRRFPYLRLSVTDLCNFRCTYCLPNGQPKTPDRAFLSRAEIHRLITGFTGLGVTKVRFTGGEPCLRQDLCELISDTRAIPGISELALTTNGYNLLQLAPELYDAGIRALNVSVDSLDPGRFARLTGHDRLDRVLEGIERARQLGFAPIKINVVLLRDFTDAEFEAFLDWARRDDLSIRFIELMQTGDNLAFFREQHVCGSTITERLQSCGFRQRPRTLTGGPAVEFDHPDFRGRMGLIAPYSKDFCTTCNRLRVTARGDLRLCLFGNESHSLRPLLADNSQTRALQEKLHSLLGNKTASHLLHQGDTGLIPHLATLGG
jgi:cyclic pyranopterin phosphate synthase